MAIATYRILCIGETWYGSDARAAFAALRRHGHSVHVLDENNYVSNRWQTIVSKGLRKLFKPILVKELELDADRLIRRFKPHCLFVFKGNWVHPGIVENCHQQNVLAVNYYPDVSFLAHGPYIPRTLPLYDHIFNTKTYGVEDMRLRLGIEHVSFLEPGYDPELHSPVELNEEESKLYGCDVAFIGTWSPKKELALSLLRSEMPSVRLKIWGSQWARSNSLNLKDSIMGDEVTGGEYTKAIRGASICLGLLSEVVKGASSGDLITARTFQIPACGTFMLHEHNPEVLRYFNEDEVAFFATSQELAKKVDYYLTHGQERERLARQALERSIKDEYSIDGRMKVVLRWLDERLSR